MRRPNRRMMHFVKLIWQTIFLWVLICMCADCVQGSSIRSRVKVGADELNNADQVDSLADTNLDQNPNSGWIGSINLNGSNQNEMQNLVRKAIVMYAMHAENTMDRNHILHLFANNYQSKLSPYCNYCKMALFSTRSMIKMGFSKTYIVRMAKNACQISRLVPKVICEGLAQTFQDEAYQVIKASNVSTAQLCTMILGVNCFKDEKYDWVDWKVDIPIEPPEKKSAPKWYEQKESKRSDKMYTIIHFSDAHVDPLYRENSSAQCNEPLCCRSGNRKYVTPELDAGRWGAYGSCDIPRRTYELALKSIGDLMNGKASFGIWTGDIPPHDIWMQSEAQQLDKLQYAAKQITQFIEFPVFSAVGNHESYPVDSFPHSDLPISGKSMDWLYNQLHDHWTVLFQNSTPTDDQIKYGAYYSTMMFPNLKIISINTNYCNTRNFWLVLNPKDPQHQLTWLVEQLLDAEQKNHAVFIIGHIPPGLVDCLPVWSSNYYQIVNRFSNVIRSQFFGHQHKSSFSMFYRFDLESSQFNITSTNVAYIGPSLTSYVGVNPSFRVYLVNSETHEIFNYYTYTLDLKKANLLGPDEEPQFKLLYSAREAYHLKNLRPQSWHRLAMRLENDYKQMNDYLDKTYGGSDSAAYRQSKCTDEECLKKQTCAMVNSVSFNPTFCDYILKLSEADHYDP